MTQTRPAPGDRLGPYEIEAEIGRGGMGQVFRARDTRLDRTVAIKMVRPDLASREEFRRRFEREARTVSTLSHPNICTLFDIAEHEGQIYLVMEYVEGDSLASVLATRRLSVDEARRLGVEMASALAAAHAKGIVHRDLKPGNIMVSPHGLKVLDFGLATKVERTDVLAETAAAESTLTGAGVRVGTAAYMSPEQIAARRVDARSDVFSAGVILYEMLAGSAPFRGDSNVEIFAAILGTTPAPLHGSGRHVPADLGATVSRCLQRLPEDRFASGAELLSALQPRAASRGMMVKGWWVGAAAAAVLVATVGYVWWSRAQEARRARWVEETAVPQIARFIEEDRGLAALSLYKQAERAAPASRALIKVSEGVAAKPADFASNPPGATLYIADYAAEGTDDLSKWQRLGTAPLTVPELPVWAYYRVRAAMPGYLTTDVLFGGTSSLTIEMRPAADAPEGMVWVPPTSPDESPVALPGYWLSRYEITNAQYKRFVDAGGYHKPQYWTEPMTKDGRRLSLQEAVDGFRDATGRPGPAAWQLSAFPAGAEQLPVTGVSWFEAAAYAAFAGESLPTYTEWRRAAGNGVNANIVLFSNFGAKHTVPVGSLRGMSPFGSFDMAGNAKEWTATAGADGLRYTLGGGWDEPRYAFADRDARQPLARDSNMGFRTIRRVEPAPAAILASLPLSTPPPVRTVSEAEYKVFLGLHEYDTAPLDARIERTVDTSPYWRRETASFRSAYGQERVLAHVFLPKDAAPPYQAVVTIGGATIMNALRRVEDFDYPFEFIIRSGRAVVIPAMSGTLERGPTPSPVPPGQFRDLALRWSKDIGRTLEYLDTRSDIDRDRLGLYGVSLGAVDAVRFLAIYPRFKASVLSSGGLQAWYPLEVNSWNFAPHVQTPVLMVNGRYDTIFPLETNQKLLFQALGPREPAKRHLLYDGGHRNLVTRPDLIGEIVDWLDTYLGPSGPR